MSRVYTEEQKLRKSAAMKIWYIENKERLLARKRVYNAENRERTAKRQKAWKDANKERLAESQKSWRIKNKDKHKEYLKSYRATEHGHAKELVTAARCRAKKHSIPCNITVDDLHFPTHCPILGIVLSRGDGKAANNSYSIDRIIPELGYVKGNVMIISHLANVMKNSASKEMLLKFCENAPKIYGDCR